LSNPFFATIAQGVSEAAEQHELGVFVVDSREKADEGSLLRRLVRQTDGVILAAPRDVEADLRVIGSAPAVVINQEGPRAVVTDVADGVRQAMKHLVELGHRRIAYLGGPASSWGDAKRREALAVESASRAADGLRVITLGAFAPSAEGGEAAAEAVEATAATAVLTYNDIVAVGLIRALRLRGIVVPDDVSVVSFDGTFLAPLVTPALTSAGTDLRALGRAAANHLITADERASHVQPVTLKVRESTAPPRPRSSAGA
ncbi:MAG TPA: LacI family transcriptional regulator, partial [Micrococcales bacterium]|nr:LacI family transcriptional regulator [Micrococcales bacterium]